MFSFKKCLLMVSICAASFTMMSCDKDSSSSTAVVNPDITQSSNSLSCTISGKYNVNFNSARTIKSSVNCQMMIDGFSSDTTEQVVITFFELPNGVQTIDLQKDHKIMINYLKCSRDLSSFATFFLIEGTVNITENTDKVIKGTFDCNTGILSGTDYLSLKDGKFSCNK